MGRSDSCRGVGRSRQSGIGNMIPMAAPDQINGLKRMRRLRCSVCTLIASVCLDSAELRWPLLSKCSEAL